MRPVKMIMSAFGPYAEETIIDFDSLGTCGVYLVCGDTGAGKTIIFDAISFALFGQTSGSSDGSRDVSSLRSHYADLATETFVELEFEYRGKRYIVKRNPKHKVLKKRGEGVRDKLAGATLTMPDGKVISGVKNVDAAVKDLLGISASQFKQIVMLAQGEFRDILTAKTKDRENIFRNLFKTERYNKLSDLIEKEHKVISDENAQAKQRIKTLANNASFPEGSTQSTELSERLKTGEELGPWLIENLGKYVEQQALELDERTESLDSLRAQWYELDTLRKKALPRQEAEQACAELENKIAALEAEVPRLASTFEEHEKLDEQRIGLEKQAAVIESTFGKYHELETAQANLNAASNAVASAEEAVGHAEEECIAAKTKKDELSERMRALEGADVQLAKAEALNSGAERELNDAKQMLVHAQSLAEKEQALQAAEQTLQEARGALDAAEENKSKAEGELEQALLGRASFEGADVALVEAKATRERAAERLASVEKLITRLALLEEDVENAQMPYEQKRDAYRQAEEIYSKDHAVLQALNMRQRTGRAGLLASELQEGVACPVCGSTHHPSPAQDRNSIPKDAEIDEATAKEASSKQNATALSLEAERLKTALEEKKAALAAFEDENGSKQQLDELVEAARAASQQAQENLESAQDRKAKLDAANETVKLAQDAHSTAVKAAEEAQSAYQEKTGAALAAKTEVQTLRSNLNAASLPEAQNAYNRAKVQYGEAKEQFETAQANAARKENANKQLASAIEELEQAERKLASAQEAARGAAEGKKLAAERAEHLRADLDYASLALAQQQAQSLRSQAQDMLQAREAARKAVEENSNSITNSKGLLAERKKQLDGIPQIDLKATEEKLSELEQQGKQANEELLAANVQLNANKNCLDNVAAALEKIGDLEQRYGRVKLLSEVANGRLSQKRLNFEAYVQSIYFDRVIRAANRRLKIMTGGRFELERNIESDGTAQTGLGLKVIDNFTGRSRDASSLSGGESFQASLCLALGLSDTVQAHSGGIMFDTMFVDEGFGSLDHGTLNNAVTLLSELSGSSKLIGIISHVDELRANIPKKIIVTKSRYGSSVEMDV